MSILASKACALAFGAAAAGAALSTRGAPAFYVPGSLADPAKSGLILDPPTQEGVKIGDWRVEQGIELYHFSTGEGEPVLVIHGGPGAPFQTSWKGLDTVNGFQFVYYHQRGCGKSTMPIDRFAGGDYYGNMQELDRKLGMAAQITDIERIRRILGVEKLAIIGHSYGGFIAALYAIEFPDRVKKMILVAPASVLSLPAADGGMDGIRNCLTDDGKKRYDEFQKSYFDFGSIFRKSENDLEELNSKFGDFYVEALRNSVQDLKGLASTAFNSGGWVVQAIYMSVGSRYDYRNLCKKIKAPTLVIHGERDIQPAESSEVYAELIPGAGFTIISGASHFAFDEKPEEFAGIVGGFLGNK
jgi:proline iminopeptidase